MREERVWFRAISPHFRLRYNGLAGSARSPRNISFGLVSGSPSPNVPKTCPKTSFPRRPPGAMIEPMNIRLIRHEAVPKTGSYEVRFPDGRPSRFFYWDDIPGRRLRPDLVDSATAERDAKAFARAEQDKLA